jgi:hypothetical protein
VAAPRRRGELVPFTTRFVNHGGDIRPPGPCGLRTAAQHLMIPGRGPLASLDRTGQRIHNLFEGLRRAIDEDDIPCGDHGRNVAAGVPLIAFSNLTQGHGVVTALGWTATGQASGVNHTLWAHPSVPVKLAVPKADLILDTTARVRARSARP